MVLEAVRKGVVLGQHNVLLCAMCGADGRWVLRAVKAADYSRAAEAATSNPLNVARVREAAEGNLRSVAPRLWQRPEDPALRRASTFAASSDTGAGDPSRGRGNGCVG